MIKLSVIIFSSLILLSCGRISKKQEDVEPFIWIGSSIPSKAFFINSVGLDTIVVENRINEIVFEDTIYDLKFTENGNMIFQLDYLIRQDSLFSISNGKKYLIRNFSDSIGVIQKNGLEDFNQFQLEDSISEKLERGEVEYIFKIRPNYQFFMTDKTLLNKYHRKNYPIEYLKFNKMNKLIGLRKVLDDSWYIVEGRW